MDYPRPRPLLTLAALLPAAALGAQQVVLEENFSQGVPPPGWTSVSLGATGAWTGDPQDPGQAFHDDYCAPSPIPG